MPCRRWRPRIWSLGFSRSGPIVPLYAFRHIPSGLLDHSVPAWDSLCRIAPGMSAPEDHAGHSGGLVRNEESISMAPRNEVVRSAPSALQSPPKPAAAVSVAIVTYNVREYLRACLDS